MYKIQTIVKAVFMRTIEKYKLSHWFIHFIKITQSSKRWQKHIAYAGYRNECPLTLLNGLVCGKKGPTTRAIHLLLCPRNI